MQINCGRKIYWPAWGSLKVGGGARGFEASITFWTSFHASRMQSHSLISLHLIGEGDEGPIDPKFKKGAGGFR